MLGEFQSHILIRRIEFRKLEGYLQHVLAEHRHPRCAVRLLEEATRREGRAAVEYSDVVESQEAALEDVLSVTVLPVYPPREVEHELVEYLFQEFYVTLSVNHFLRVIEE